LKLNDVSLLHNSLSLSEFHQIKHNQNDQIDLYKGTFKQELCLNRNKPGITLFEESIIETSNFYFEDFNHSIILDSGSQVSTRKVSKNLKKEHQIQNDKEKLKVTFSQSELKKSNLKKSTFIGLKLTP
jgi:hypothetical protein